MEFAVAEKLSLLQAPDSVRRHQMEMLIEKVFPKYFRCDAEGISKRSLEISSKK
ncbi:hypothetical protein OFY05_23550 (plasmid) [Pseudocitrobacter faecalis]|nr:hypothetical protein OFY05_23550 [Pseudocitrobacter faecalis]